jgi:hypothetical protein
VSDKIDEATAALARSKDAYTYALRQVDKILESAIARDSADLTAARTLQNQYATGLAGTRLVPGLQGPFTEVEVPQIADTVSAVLA